MPVRFVHFLLKNLDFYACAMLLIHYNFYPKDVYFMQSWALTLFFQVRSPLSAQFLSMDRYRSIAHLAHVQNRSLPNRSKKTVVRSWKRALKRLIAPETTWVRVRSF